MFGSRGHPKGNAAMSKTNCKKRNCVIYKQLDGMQLSEHERQRARYAVRDAEAIVHVVIWITEGIASLGAVLPKLGFKH